MRCDIYIFMQLHEKASDIIKLNDSSIYSRYYFLLEKVETVKRQMTSFCNPILYGQAQ